MATAPAKCSLLRMLDAAPPTLAQPMLRLDQVQAWYGPIPALRGVSIEVGRGEVVCLLGGNASGKSTTMKTILGIVRPRSGTVTFADERIDDLGPLLPLLEGFATRGKALVVVAREVTGPALHTLVRNHRENGLRAAALRPAAVGRPHD